MAGERVEVANKEEQHEAERILGDIRRKYGIRLSSPMALAGLFRSTKEFAGDAKGLQEGRLHDLERPRDPRAAAGLKRFAPILGKKRAQSTRKGNVAAR